MQTENEQGKKKLTKKAKIIIAVIAVFILAIPATLGYISYAKSAAVSDYKTAYANLEAAKENAETARTDMDDCVVALQDNSIGSYEDEFDSYTTFEETRKIAKDTEYPETVTVNDFATARKVQKQIDEMNSLTEKLNASVEAYKADVTEICLSKAKADFEKRNKDLQAEIDKAFKDAEDAIKKAKEVDYNSTDEGKKLIPELNKLTATKPTVDKIPEFKTCADIEKFGHAIDAKKESIEKISTAASNLHTKAVAHERSKLSIGEQSGLPPSGITVYDDGGRMGITYSGNTAGYTAPSNYNHSAANLSCLYKDRNGGCHATWESVVAADEAIAMQWRANHSNEWNAIQESNAQRCREMGMDPNNCVLM